MKILITGGSGYWGSKLLPILAEKGHDVSVLDLQNPSVEGYTAFFKGAVTDRKAVRDAVKGMDAVVHMAALSGVAVCEKNPSLSEEVNVKGTKIVAEEIPDDSFILFISSSAVYGRMDGKITEETKENPLNTYGIHKLEAEKIIKGAGISYSIVRPSNLYGVSSIIPLKYAIHKMVSNALEKGKIYVSDRNMMRNFIHVADASRALSMILEKRKRCLCNIGDMDMLLYDIALKISDIIFERYGTRVDVDSEIGYTKVSLKYKWELLKKMGFSPEISFDDGIAELIDALSMR